MNKIPPDEFDLIVIGGGINGAAIARDSALRGMKVILFEKNDYACGASSKSSKLVHGGLRYLENYQFNLVKESLKERSTLLKIAPHQVKLIPFIFPVYNHFKHPLWKIKLGLWLYDWLSPIEISKHQNLTQNDVIKILPNLHKEGLKGGCLYYDAQMLDNRLVFSNLLSAKQAGALTLNHTEVCDLFLMDNKIKGVFYLKSDTQEKLLCKGKTVVNCTGAWANEINALDNKEAKPLVKPTKGIHIVIPSIEPTYALTLLTPQDSRVFFMIPWNGYTLVGTTDTHYTEETKNPTITKDEVSYLLESAKAYYPHLNLKSVLAAFAGLRPLINNSSTLSESSREHKITITSKGLISIVGGKYTTYRSMAKEVVDKVISLADERHKFKPCLTDKTPLYNSKDVDLIRGDKNKIAALANEHFLEITQLEHLIKNYGSAFHAILDIIRQDPTEAEQICATHPHLLAELTYTVKCEQVNSIEDWFLRRTQIAFLPCKGIECLPLVSKKLGKLLGWSSEEIKQKSQTYSTQIKAMYPFQI